jgi:hypothetical protein
MGTLMPHFLGPGPFEVRTAQPAEATDGEDPRDREQPNGGQPLAEHRE